MNRYVHLIQVEWFLMLVAFDGTDDEDGFYLMMKQTMILAL